MFVNTLDCRILMAIRIHPAFHQRQLATELSCSLGAVNNSLRRLKNEGYLSDQYRMTHKAETAFRAGAPRNAIILAAGIGMRMVPINTIAPKALMEVRGELLIERLIRQLHEVGIQDITIVVGFMKERFDYLIDEYGVRLVVNSAYTEKNNLTSLALTVDRISNTYILPSDLWFADNPFRKHELCSWYMVSDRKHSDSEVRVNRKQELVHVDEDEDGNAMIGLAYLLEQDAAVLRKQLKAMAKQPQYDGAFWETALYQNGKMLIPARIISAETVTEINTYEQLREFDRQSGQLKSDAMDVIVKTLRCKTEDITDITILKKGMTNRSFLFRAKGERYIMRIPGEGTDQLINRRQEADVFHTISGLGLCDDPVYINPVNGYKITRYLDGVRVCDAENVEDLKRCMSLLKRFHEMNLQVKHEFDIFRQIEFYEQLWEGRPSAFRDYAQTKQNVLSLRAFIDRQPKGRCLTHIDAVPDNFLFYIPVGERDEQLQLTDWEYAGMQDPHVDIAMFCIYSLFDKERIDRLIDIYFMGDCVSSLRAKIYCYIAACGLLWSNWTEYKRNLGVEFGEYGMRQYRYAKDYYRYALEEMKTAEETA